MARRTRMRAMAAALTAVAVLPGVAGADTTWTKISTEFASVSIVPSVGLVGPTAVVAWTQQTSVTATDLNALSFTTSPTQDVSGQASSPVVQGWEQVDSTSALFAAPGGGLQIAFAGVRTSAVPDDPFRGLFTRVRNGDGTWGAPVLATQSISGGGPMGGALAGAVPWVVAATTGINLHDAAITQPAGTPPAQELQAQLGGCCGYTPRLALDGTGRLWIAWYSSSPAYTGIFVQQLDPATAAPLGPPAKAPGSESVFNNSFGTVLTCAGPACRVVYGNQPAGGSVNEIVSWWPGEAAPRSIATLDATADRAGRVVTAAYRADGRLWVAWFDGLRYRATLGDATGAGGEVQDAGVPQGEPRGAYALAGVAVGENLLLAANYAWKDVLDPARNAIFVNTIAPPAPVTKAPGPRDVSLQTTPGGKGFRIQVQYTMPAACTGAAPCTLRAELRTRTGRRLYAVAPPLAGDTKLVLGTRPRVVVPKGTKGKIRFYLTVRKAQLLKAPFTTQAGSRVAETRLRVWSTPKGQKAALSVRDGRIKVSIARIRSGALPGLSGIL